MSSSTITVKAKRRTARSPPPSANTKPTPTGTVLLRNPLPKYNFQVAKDAKPGGGKSKPFNSDKRSMSETSLKSENGEPRNQENITVTNADDISRGLDNLSAPNAEEVLVNGENTTAGNIPGKQKSVVSPVEVGKIIRSYPQVCGPPAFASGKVTDASQVDVGQTASIVLDDNDKQADLDVSVTVGKLTEKPVNIVDPFSTQLTNKLTHSCSESAILPSHTMQNYKTVSRVTTNVPCSDTLSLSTTGVSNSNLQSDSHSPGSQTSVLQSVVSAVSLQPGAPAVQTASTNQQQAVADTYTGISPITTVAAAAVCDCSSRLQKLEEEKELLKSQLAVQIQVNQELKKLLVASIGEDLQHRVEWLMADKAQLSLEVGDYSKRVTEDYENLDKVSIQADMWRSKYKASRVMSDELAAAKAFYCMQFQEAQMAIHQLLNERHELRANLYEAYRGLKQIKGAFDPFNSEQSSKQILTANHVLDLARTNQQLVESIKYRLLPSHVTTSLANKMEPDWCDYLTKAESYAQELLSRDVRPEDFRHLVPSKLRAPTSMTVDRYHPLSRFDNLTFNVCCHCKGEITIV